MTDNVQPVEQWELQYIDSEIAPGYKFTEPMFKFRGKYVPFEEVLTALNSHVVYEQALRGILDCLGAPDPHVPEKNTMILRGRGLEFEAAIRAARAVLGEGKENG